MHSPNRQENNLNIQVGSVSTDLNKIQGIKKNYEETKNNISEYVIKWGYIRRYI